MRLPKRLAKACTRAASWYAEKINRSPSVWSTPFFTIVSSSAIVLTAGLTYGYVTAPPTLAPWLALLFVLLALGYIVWTCIHYRAIYNQPRNALRQWAAEHNRSSEGQSLSSLLAADPFWNTLGEDLAALARSSNRSRAGSPLTRLHTERLSRKTRSLDTLYEVVAALNDAHTRDDMLATFLDVLVELLDASAAQVFLRQDGHLIEVARVGDPDSIIARYGVSNRIHETNDMVVTSGRFAIQKIYRGKSNDVSDNNVTSAPFDYISVPVRYRNTILGLYTMILPNAVAALGDDFWDLVTSVGRHLGLALEKARLDDHARRLAVMEERDILSNELHDTLAQYLVSMRLQAKMLGELLYKQELRAAESEAWRLRLTIEEAHSSLRELLSSFRFKMDERGLLPALQDLVTRFEQDTRITTFLHYKISDLRLSPTQEVEVYRIIQEALANIRRHSRAMTARVLLLEDQNRGYRIIVEDDGIGFPEGRNGSGETNQEEGVERKEPNGTHIGLAIMRERCKRLGGTLHLESEPGEGTRVTLKLPLKAVPSPTAGSPTGSDHEGYPS